MPYSSKECKPEILDWFNSRDDIHTVIDIGCGSGTYPKLLAHKNYKWIGVEIWEPYIERFKLEEFYDKIYVGNFFRFIHKLEGDCIIFGDVLEHMQIEDAKKAISLADQKFKHVVISTPINYEQEECEGNPYEKHLSIWSMELINSIVPESFTIRGISWDIALFIK
jgi:2-polyprenyl-3-methyl-5-hydroxy-6-metoxy-1,4-benzoquinol methylase